MRIARSSGRPPSVIEETWTLDEILDVAALDELEGAGQAKRLVGRICAEIHNAVRDYAWARYADKGSPPPKPLDESHWLPRRVSKKPSESNSSGGRQLTQGQAVSRQITQAFSDWW